MKFQYGDLATGIFGAGTPTLVCSLAKSPGKFTDMYNLLNINPIFFVLVG